MTDQSLLYLANLGFQFIDNPIDRDIHFLRRHLGLQAPAMKYSDDFRSMMKFLDAQKDLQTGEFNPIAIKPPHPCLDVLSECRGDGDVAPCNHQSHLDLM